jgi:hypothetical protein
MAFATLFFFFCHFFFGYPSNPSILVILIFLFFFLIFFFFHFIRFFFFFFFDLFVSRTGVESLMAFATLFTHARMLSISFLVGFAESACRALRDRLVRSRYTLD